MLKISHSQKILALLLLTSISVSGRAKVIEPIPTQTPGPIIIPALCKKKPTEPPQFYNYFQFSQSLTGEDVAKLRIPPMNVGSVLGGVKNKKWTRLATNSWFHTYEFHGINLANQVPPKPDGTPPDKINVTDIYTCSNGSLTLHSVMAIGSITKKTKTGRTLLVGIGPELLATIRGKFSESNGTLWISDELKGKLPKNDYRIQQSYSFSGPKFSTWTTVDTEKSVYALGSIWPYHDLVRSLPRGSIIDNPLVKVDFLAVNQKKCENSETYGWQCAHFDRLLISQIEHQFEEAREPNHVTVKPRVTHANKVQKFLDVLRSVEWDDTLTDDEAVYFEVFTGEDSTVGGPYRSVVRSSFRPKADNSASHDVAYAEDGSSASVKANCPDRDRHASCVDPSGVLDPAEVFFILDNAKRIEGLIGGPGLGF